MLCDHVVQCLYVCRCVTMLYNVYTSVGVWVFLTILPTLIVNTKREDRPITTQDYIGWSMWVTGFLLETIADSQKSSFRANPENQVGITESTNCRLKVLDLKVYLSVIVNTIRFTARNIQKYLKANYVNFSFLITIGFSCISGICSKQNKNC